MFKLLVIKNKKSFTRQWFFIDRQIEMTIFLCNTVINFVCRWTNHAAVWKLFFACMSKIESENRYFKICKHQKSYCWIVCRRLGKMRVFKSPTLKIENYTFKKNNWRVELLNFIFTKKKKKLTFNLRKSDISSRGTTAAWTSILAPEIKILIFLSLKSMFNSHTAN